MHWVTKEADGTYRHTHEQSFRCACGYSFQPNLVWVEGCRVPWDLPVHCPECFALVAVFHPRQPGNLCPGCRMPLADAPPPSAAPGEQPKKKEDPFWPRFASNFRRWRKP